MLDHLSLMFQLFAKYRSKSRYSYPEVGERFNGSLVDEEKAYTGIGREPFRSDVWHNDNNDENADTIAATEDMSAKLCEK